MLELLQSLNTSFNIFILMVVQPTKICMYTQCSLPPSVALLAKILGNRQMFPVPTTEPIIVRRTPMEDVK